MEQATRVHGIYTQHTWKEAAKEWACYRNCQASTIFEARFFDRVIWRSAFHYDHRQRMIGKHNPPGIRAAH